MNHDLHVVQSPALVAQSLQVPAGEVQLQVARRVDERVGQAVDRVHDDYRPRIG